MYRSPPISSHTPSQTLFMALNGLLLQFGWAAGAEVLATPLPGASPLGLRAVLPGGTGTGFAPVEGFKGGFDYGLAAHAIYDSNFLLTDTNPKSELSSNILPWIRYSSDAQAAAPFSLTASYQPILRVYEHNSNLNGVDNSGGISLKVAGAKTFMAAYLNYNTVSGTDSYSGTFVKGVLLATGLRSSYQIAPRTTLFASLGTTQTDYGSSSLVGSTAHTAEVGGMWAATERCSFGPGLRYTKDQSDNTGTREAWSLNMNARYLMDTQLQFMASLGVQHATNSRDAGNSTVGLTGALAASYSINERWMWDSSIRYVNEPSANDVNYIINHLTASTTLTRQLLRGSVSLGLEWVQSDYTQVGTVGTQLSNESNYNAVLSYHRTMCLDRLDFDTSIRYAINEGNRNWSQLQVSAGVTLRF